MDESVLEYNDEQGQFHIHKMSDREKLEPVNNKNWRIIFTGTSDECWNIMAYIKEGKLCL